MSSTLVGRSGNAYVRGSVLQRHPVKPELDICLAQCKGRSYVLKPVSRSIFEHSLELKHDLRNNPYIRIHVDDNETEQVLVYEYYRDNLFSLIKRCPELPVGARKRILWEVACGLRDLRVKDWIHLDTKPNNVLLDWTLDQYGQFKVGRMVLSDMDCALKVRNDKLLNQRVGNVMWRSLEGQAGKGVGKPSEVFSFGLICLYTITGVETLHPDFEQLRENGTEPEHVLLYKLLSMFGPVPTEFIEHIADPYWTELLTALAKVVAEEDNSVRFAQWDESHLPNLNVKTKRMILCMTNLNPQKRLSMDQVTADSWWKEL